MADWKELIPDPSVVAAAAGSLIAAVKRKGYSYAQRASSFCFGFSAAIYLVPYSMEKIGVQSVRGVVAFSFITGFLSDAALTPLLEWAEKNAPHFVEKWANRKIGGGKNDTE
jgi:hypothetical protein